MFGNLIEDWILLLFSFPVSDIGGGQPCWPSLHHLFLAISPTIWSRPDSLLSTLFNGHDSIVKHRLDPWVRDLVQVLLNFLLREAFIHQTQKVGNRVVLTFLVLQGEVVASEGELPIAALQHPDWQMRRYK